MLAVAALGELQEASLKSQTVATLVASFAHFFGYFEYLNNQIPTESCSLRKFNFFFHSENAFTVFPNKPGSDILQQKTCKPINSLLTVTSPLATHFGSLGQRRY